MEMGQNPVPPMTLKSLLKGGNHPQKGTLGFDPKPYYPRDPLLPSKLGTGVFLEGFLYLLRR